MSSVSEDILIRFRVDDQTASGINAVKSRFNAFRAAAGVAVTAVGSQMLSFSKTCVQSAIQAEQGWNAYSTALERVGGTAGRSLSSVKSEVSSLASELGRSTADVRQAATDFMNYGVSASTALKGASAVSAIAAAKNMDYASSEQIVMSALKGRGAQLKTLGIDIDDYKDATSGAIDTTRLFADVQKKFGSSQEAYSDSAVAQQQRMTNAINGFKTAVGTALMPLLEAVTPLLTAFAKALGSNDVLASVVAYTILFGGALSALSGPLMTIEAIMGSQMFASFASGISRALSPMKNLVTESVDLYRAWKERPDLFDDSIFAKMSRLKESLVGVKARAVEAAKNLGSMVKSGVTGGLNKVKSALSSVKAGLISAGQAALSAAKSLASMAKAAAVSALNGLKNVLVAVKTAAVQAGTALLTTAKNVLLAGVNAARAAAMWLVQKVQLVASTVATYAMAAAQAVLNVVMSLNPVTVVIVALVALVAVLVLAYNRVSWFRNMVNQLGQSFIALVQIIYSAIMSIPGVITGATGSAYSAAVNLGMSIYNGVVSGVMSLVSAIVNVFNQIVSTISSFASTVYNAAKNIGQSIYNGVMDGIGSVTSLLGFGAGGADAGVTYSGAGGADAGLSYRGAGNPVYSGVRASVAGNPVYNKSVSRSRTVVLNEGALSVDARNLSTTEAKQVVIGALESL